MVQLTGAHLECGQFHGQAMVAARPTGKPTGPTGFDVGEVLEP